MGELKKLKEDGSPFTEEFFQLLQTVYKSHTEMLESLRNRKQKLHRKLWCIRSWTKVTSAIFVTTLVAVVICSVVVAAAVAAPPVAIALSAATAVPISSIGKWGPWSLEKIRGCT